ERRSGHCTPRRVRGRGLQPAGATCVPYRSHSSTAGGLSYSWELMSVRDSGFNPVRTAALLAVLSSAIVVLPACSLKSMAVKTVANTLSDTGDVFTRDDDPDLIRDATPFALKLYESLLESVPTHVPLLVSTCGSFTQYGYAFLESEADGLDASRRSEAVALRDRALKHYLRAHGYCMRG